MSQEGRIERLRRRHLHRSTFRRWAIGTVQLGTARASLVAALQHAVHDRFVCVFHAWYHVASSRKRSRRTVDLLAARRCHAAVSRAWQGWKGWCARCTVHCCSLYGASQALKKVARTSLHQQVTAVRSISSCTFCTSHPIHVSTASKPSRRYKAAGEYWLICYGYALQSLTNVCPLCSCGGRGEGGRSQRSACDCGWRQRSECEYSGPP